MTEQTRIGTATESAAGAVSRRYVVVATLALVLLALAVFWPTVWSMVAIWERSETFMHGFFIAPISLYLIWRKRKALAAVPIVPNYGALVLLAGAGFVWLLAHFAGVLVIQQLALVAMIPLIVWVVQGWRMAWALAFPLGFLFFAVPMGEALIPPMMNFTADFTVKMLQLTGIPVFREGTFFEIPTGRWSVVEGCSGLRYLIASVTLGFLYAYLTYRSLRRRLLFIAAAFVVPVIANGLRAYMIVMIAHLSDMRLALGVDHFIYGWVFFGGVMLLLFWLGAFWREDDVHQPEDPAKVPAAGVAMLYPQRKSFLVVGVAILVLLAIWTLLGGMNTNDTVSVNVSITVPAPQGGWQPAADPLSEWRPRYINADASIDQTYHRGDQEVSLYVAYYRTQRQDAELINSQNVLVKQKDKVWWQTADSSHDITLGGKHLEVRLAKMRSEHQDLLVWYWFWVDGRTTINPYLAKLLSVKAKLLGETGDAAAVIISTPYSDQGDEGEQALQEYMMAMQGSIAAALENAAGD